MGEFNEHSIKASSAFLMLIFAAGLIVGGTASFYIFSQQINSLRNDVSNLETQVSKLSGSQNITYQNTTIYQNVTALSEIYKSTRDSVVLIRVTTNEATVQGSGFVYNFSGTIVVLTNYHVVHGTIMNISATFSNGNGYAATVNGTDPYADIAVLSVDAPENEFKPLGVVSSSTLKVGDPVIAIGNPFGLVGSMTAGEVSALGRTITEEYTGGFMIANVIQTSTPINPGNSGGPLLNYLGRVVGITTAIVADSQGLGFAIPSDTILKEIASLIENGTYNGHSYIGVRGADMNYETAQEIGVNVTYGWRIAEVIKDEPAYKAGVESGDVIIAINGTRVKNGDDMASYLEENTLPGETVILKVVRGNQTLEKPLTLGKRPSPPV